ncbi:LysR family transcriptional regulator [Aequoribacter sp.]|uniref:LysR family transcriptional regulator n=1 Tax=Aequoribacter sp. TaxID=2847771 RepID=UPI003F6A1340
MNKRFKNLRGIDLNLLTVFEGIMEFGQLSAAGAQLGLSQPAMSSALQRLRVMLDDELFVRTKYGMVPTPKAEAWYADIAPILNQLRESFAAKFESPQTSSRCFSVVAGDYFETVYLAPLLQRLQTEAPSVSVSVFPLSEQGIPQDFRYGKYDFALYRSPPSGSGVSHQVLGEETLVVMRSAHHPRVCGGLTLTGFLNEKHVVMEAPRHAPHGLNTLLPAQPIKRDIVATVTSFSAAALIVESTDALCTVPMGLASVLSRRFDIAIETFPSKLEPINRMLVWPSVLEKDPMHSWFRELLLEVVGK